MSALRRTRPHDSLEDLMAYNVARGRIMERQLVRWPHGGTSRWRWRSVERTLWAGVVTWDQRLVLCKQRRAAVYPIPYASMGEAALTSLRLPLWRCWQAPCRDLVVEWA